MKKQVAEIKDISSFSANAQYEEVVDTVADAFVLADIIEDNAVKGNALMTGVNIALKGTPLIIEIAQDAKQFVAEFSTLPPAQAETIVKEAMQIAVTRRGEIKSNGLTFFFMNLILQNAKSYDFVDRFIKEGTQQVKDYRSVFGILKKEDGDESTQDDQVTVFSDDDEVKTEPKEVTL